VRNPDRIPVVLESLRRLWERNPDWRLGQLIWNCEIHWHTEDDEAKEKLDSFEWPPE
jgi:hypothetical protein